MSSLPPAIIFINADINDGVKSTLVSQLSITDVLTDTEFDARVIADPNYPFNIHSQGLRVLVIRQSFRDLTNRNLADVVMFYSHGQIYIEKNNYGPPRQSYPIERLNVYEILRANKSKYVVILPDNHPPPHHHCNCHENIGPGGIVGIELRAGDSSGVHAPNCDNEYNNKDFINRK